MKDEYADRSRAIKMRLAGQSVAQILSALRRSKEWFHKWWNRYLEFGPDGLFDLTHANHQVAQRIAPELERAILTIRRRLQARATPATRYQLIGGRRHFNRTQDLADPALALSAAPSSEFCNATA